MNPKWKPKKESYSEALKYMGGRKQGTITSLKTPWGRLDSASTNGLEWNSVFVIAARPGGFKTATKDQIINNAFRLNPTTKFRVLDFQMEMLGRVTAIREFSSTLGKSYKYLCSAEVEQGEQLILSKEDYMACYEYAKNRAKTEEYPIDVVEEAYTINEFVSIIDEYMEQHKQEKGEFTPTIIGIDHTRLFVRAPYESEEEMIFNLSTAVTRLKKKYPLIFIILSQLNRNYELAARHEDGKYANYITAADIFGSDSILQAADLVVGLNRPGSHGIRHYGPSRFQIDSDRIIAAHFIKSRNGEVRTSFFEAVGERFEIIEIEPPPSALRKLPTMTPFQTEKREAKEVTMKPLEPNTLFTEQIYTNQTPNF